MGAKRGKVRSEEGLTDSRYQPTKAELEEDVSIDASPEDVARAVMGDVEARVVGGEKGKKKR